MTSEPTALFDLPAYLRRVGLTGAPPASSAGLGALHQAHVTHIPFENADVVLGRPVRLDPDSLQRKLVRECRGGYCFEQNLLFAAALEAIGLRVTKLAARVRYRATRLLPRTHMLLKVEADGGPWLADVGFGGGGLILPLPLAAGAESRQHSWTYRLTREAGTWVLQSRSPAGWADLYAFTEEPQEDVDYEVANYYVSTHPQSPFTRTLTAQLVTPEARYTLRNRDLTIERAGGTETRPVSDDELLTLLSGTFGLTLPPDTRFPDRPWGS